MHGSVAAARILRGARTKRDLHEVQQARASYHRHPVYSLKEAYHSQPVRLLVFGLIITNFTVECIQRQVDPHAENHPGIWSGFEDFFCVAFLVELLVNMYVSWRKPFFRIGWNYFDMFVVTIGILILVRCPMPGPLSLVLMLRSFRIFRLFELVESMKRILRLLAGSLAHVLNAFVIMLLVVCAYAVLAVDLFSDYYVSINPDMDNLEITARGDRYSEEYYGTFVKALYTLFQILTGESWSEMGVRPILAASPNIPANIGGTLFFISFYLFNAVVLLNVVVAVLLDGMASASQPEGDDQGRKVSDNVQEAEVDQEGKKEQNSNTGMIPNDDDEDDELVRKDMAELKQHVYTMSVELKEVLSDLRLLEQQCSSRESQDHGIQL